jgi:hypothetical protein
MFSHFVLVCKTAQLTSVKWTEGTVETGGQRRGPRPGENFIKLFTIVIYQGL